ncbi:D-alanyl-D-alanine carboxypeptidase [Arthrobacter sp. yr096]|uniref:serine hydrolase domain-containing protein n=1 Tax=Arthrobacter sp. yr096 TaxID=1761750 RepID=UPI0008AB1DB5|nr:serine hydrolase domain-containing protein [Arthrobacter sp. yr096]SEJ00685.1 D-alanyl-D-alanine carboxypeptidase [Arthrobacter sp. yr096]
MPGRPARGILTAALVCGVFLAGCTGTPEPPPLQPTAPLPPPVTATTQPSTTGPPAVPAPTGEGAASPSDTAVVTPAFQELRAALELFSREKLQEGASAVIIRAKAGQQEWTHAAGVRSRDGQIAVQTSDRFNVGGQLRTMLGVSVMKLVEEAQVRLDDAIITHLPGSLAGNSTVTVRQLLGDLSELPGGLASRADSLLGQLVTQLRGQPLEAVLRTDILTPLDLRSTVLQEQSNAWPGDLVHGYVHVGGAVVDVVGLGPASGRASPALLSTVQEITAFQFALLGGELLSPEGLVAMKGTVFADYGLGLDHWNDRCTNGYYYGHVGDVPGYGSIAISSADGNRQLAILMAYPPQPLSEKPSALALEMTGVAQVALNSGCRFQFR